MKKKGFTLIELLAVIVILAIIALIATPIVMNVIENSRKGAAERSAENYIDAVETAIATERLDNKILEGEYTIQSDGNLCKTGTTCTDETEIKIDMSGNKPKEGTILIENGLVVDKLSNDAIKQTSIKTKDDYTVSYNTEGKLEATKEQSGNDPVEVYRNSSDEIKIGGQITGDYVTNLSELGKEYYLKHELDADNKVIASYACMIYEGDPVCLRGGTDENGNSYFSENAQKLEALQAKGVTCSIDIDNESASCSFGPDNSNSLNTYSSYNIVLFNSSYYCHISGDSSSQCVNQ